MKILFIVGMSATYILMFSFSKGYAQTLDSVRSVDACLTKKQTGYGYIIPTTLIAAGTIILLDKDADEFIFNNAEVNEERNENFGTFSTHVDDYLQHAPSLTTFILTLSGSKGKHDLPNQAAIYLKSELLMLSAVYALKNTVGEGRPDSGRRNSFPSGHTAQAFVAASFLAKEYGHKSIWISIGAYTAAATVGTLRLMNNRHWLSDVMVGAGIGILSTDIVYLTHKNRWGRSGKTHALRIDPFSSFGANGLSLTYRL